MTVVRRRVEASRTGALQRHAAWAIPLGLVIAGILLLPLELAITRWATAGTLPGSVQKAIRISEAFSHGFGAAMILLAVFVLDRDRRARMPRLVAGTLLGGILANGSKLLVSRTRPRAFDLHGSILDSFSGWFALGQLPSVQEGFPSAHAATGFGLAVMLSWAYPAGRTFFFVLAALSGYQRVHSAAHFPSDVLFGAALGCLGAYACLPGRLLGRSLDRIEERRARQPEAPGEALGA